MKRRINNFIIFIVILAVFFQFTDCSKKKEEKAKLRIGAHTTVLGAPLVIAKEKGFYEEEGINAEIKYVESSKQSIAAMSGGDLDIIIGSLAAGNLNLMERGELKIVADAARLYPSIIIRKDLWENKKITKLEDLKRKTVRVPREGSSSYYALARILQSVGLDIEDVTPKYLDETEGVAALESKNIDVAILMEPAATTAVVKGVGVRYDIKKIAAIFPKHGQQHMVIYTTDRMINNPELLKKFFNAYLKAINYYNDARTGKEPVRNEVVKIIATYTKTPTEIIESIEWPYVALDGRPNVKYIEEMQEYFFKKGLLPKKANLNEHINLSFLPTSTDISKE